MLIGMTHQQIYQNMKTKKIKIKQLPTDKSMVIKHIPTCCDEYIQDTQEYTSIEELLAIPWIASWKDIPTFYRFSISYEAYPLRDASIARLMAEFKDGYEWWVIAHLPNYKAFLLLDLPKWEAKER